MKPIIITHLRVTHKSKKKPVLPTVHSHRLFRLVEVQHVYLSANCTVKLKTPSSQMSQWDTVALCSSRIEKPFRAGSGTKREYGELKTVNPQRKMDEVFSNSISYGLCLWAVYFVKEKRSLKKEVKIANMTTSQFPSLLSAQLLHIIVTSSLKAY